MELIREFHHQHIHFRNQVSTLKILLADNTTSSSTSSTTTAVITNTNPSNIPSKSNVLPTTNNESSSPTGRSRRQASGSTKCLSPYKRGDSPNTSNSKQLKTALVKGLKNTESETSFGLSLSSAENFEQYSELKRVSLDCINKLGTHYGVIELGVKELSNLWETLTEMDEEQPGSLFLMDFEEEGEESTPFSISNSQQFSSKVNLRAQRVKVCEQVTKLINIESTLLNLIESHQSMLENNFGFSFSGKYDYERVTSSTNLLASTTKKLNGATFKDIMEYLDFPNHIQRAVSCAKLFETARKLIVPNEEEANEFCAVHVDVMGMTGASPLIRSLPSATFPNNAGTNPNIKWRECIKLEKLNKKFQRKLNEFEGVIVQFVQLKQQYS